MPKPKNPPNTNSFFCSLLSANSRKNSCRFLFSRENSRSSSYLRSFFLFTGDFWLCKHETYNYNMFFNQNRRLKSNLTFNFHNVNHFLSRYKEL
jgi:hypothetical protein